MEKIERKQDQEHQAAGRLLATGFYGWNNVFSLSASETKPLFNSGFIGKQESTITGKTVVDLSRN